MIRTGYRRFSRLCACVLVLLLMSLTACGERTQKTDGETELITLKTGNTGVTTVEAPSASTEAVSTSSEQNTGTSTAHTSSAAAASTLSPSATTSTEMTTESTASSTAEGQTETTSSSAVEASSSGESEEGTETTTASASASASGTGGFYTSIVTADPTKGVLILCNKTYRLPDDFEPAELADVPTNYYVSDGKEYKMEREALDAFMEMSDAAWAETENRVDLRIVSGYRSKSYQDWLYNNYKNQYGQDEADSYSARPRHSEHETGLCCDINMVSTSFENTEAYEWLVKNAADYGFILRYPKGKESITGYIFEAWHWRYVGVETAHAVVESGLTYDEYYEKYIAD